MNRLFLVFILFVSNILFGQNSLVLIPGTKYSMNPPEDFILSSTFSGFQRDDLGASIMISDIPSSYSDFVNEFTKEAMKAKGMNLISKEVLKLNYSEATIYIVDQEANGIKYLKQILLFGDDKKTVLVNAIYPEYCKEIGDDIKKSILTITYNDNLVENPSEIFKFSINVDGTSYKYVKSLSGTLIFTDGGEIPSNGGIITVNSSLGYKASADHEQFTIQLLKKLPHSDNSIIKTVEKVRISNLDGYEIIATNNENELLYLVILFTKDEEFYMIIGKAKEEQEQNMNIYRKVARTFFVK